MYIPLYFNQKYKKKAYFYKIDYIIYLFFLLTIEKKTHFFDFPITQNIKSIIILLFKKKKK